MASVVVADAAAAAAASVDSFSTHRLVSCPSTDPFERGVALGLELHSLARELHELLFGVWYSHLVEEWENGSFVSFDSKRTVLYHLQSCVDTRRFLIRKIVVRVLHSHKR
jgi:hypothetical protein